MIRSRHILTAFFGLVAFSLHAQGQGAGGPSPDPFAMSQQDSGLDVSGGLSAQESQARASESNRHSQWIATNGRLWMDSLKSVTKVRELLTQEWQHMGIPADQATVIASAYRGGQDRMVQQDSMKGKSAQEIASMLQSALKSKNYALANQLLIGYERNRLASESAKSQP